MIKTFTPDLEISFNTATEDQKNLDQITEPGDHIINNILNYSKNLEVRDSQRLGHIEVIKS